MEIKEENGLIYEKILGYWVLKDYLNKNINSGYHNKIIRRL